MATLTKAASAQYPLTASFNFTVADAMLNTSGALTNFKATGSPVFEIIPLPYGAMVVGGELVVITADDDSGTSTVTVGDSGSANRYLGATTLKSAARTALVPTGFVNTTTGIRITVANQNGDAANGSFQINVSFIIGSRATETLKTT